MFGVFSPRQPQSSIPQGPQEDMKIIYAVFTGPLIRKWSGKIVAFCEIKDSAMADPDFRVKSPD